MTDGDADTLSAARLATVQAARELVGLTAPSDGYLALVDPGGSPAEAAVVARESDCMLVRLGIEERVFALPARAPYVNGSAPRLLELRAQGAPWAPAGAIRLATPEAPPAPGDGVWYGKGPGGPEHVETVLSAELVSDGSLVMDVVAGGERTGAGLETVAQLRRTLRRSASSWSDAGGRPLIAIIDCDALAELYVLLGAPPEA